MIDQRRRRRAQLAARVAGLRRHDEPARLAPDHLPRGVEVEPERRRRQRVGGERVLPGRRRWRRWPATARSTGRRRRGTCRPGRRRAAACRTRCGSRAAPGTAPPSSRTGSSDADSRYCGLAAQRQPGAQHAGDRAEAAARPAVLLARVGGEVLGSVAGGERLRHVHRLPLPLVQLDRQREVLGQRVRREAADLVERRRGGTRRWCRSRSSSRWASLPRAIGPKNSACWLHAAPASRLTSRCWRSTAATARRRRRGSTNSGSSRSSMCGYGTWSQSRTSTNGASVPAEGVVDVAGLGAAWCSSRRM